jgi:hypothetical protein
LIEWEQSKECWELQAAPLAAWWIGKQLSGNPEKNPNGLGVIIGRLLLELVNIFTFHKAVLELLYNK